AAAALATPGVRIRTLPALLQPSCSRSCRTIVRRRRGRTGHSWCADPDAAGSPTAQLLEELQPDRSPAPPPHWPLLVCGCGRCRLSCSAAARAAARRSFAGAAAALATPGVRLRTLPALLQISCSRCSPIVRRRRGRTGHSWLCG